ncbi:hypothetical protein IZY60_11705 [Lutibacter sp. B2]|nr:hypothetical protein [Lutibacter sp. B2]
MEKFFKSCHRSEFDYEEDDYDKIENGKNVKKTGFTNKATMKKFEFDYEEDPYEPK